MQLTSQQQQNIDYIISAAKQAGITNPLFISGILAVVGKESNFLPRVEGSYKNTSVSRIRQVFPSQTNNLTDQQIEKLKANDQAFFNQVYGSRFGNNASGDGYRYRGRGFNQITFKANYLLAEKDTGQPLVFNPELLNEPKIAAQALIGYYKRNFPKAVNSKTYPINYDFNSVNKIDTAYNIAYNINRGLHRLPIVDTTGGYKKGYDTLPVLVDYVKKKINEPSGSTFPIILAVAVLGTGFYLFLKK
jgi:putative chitinase